MPTKFICSLSMIIALGAAPAFAQDGPSPLAALYECQILSDDAARLACYDAAVGNIQTAETNNEIVAIDTEQARSLQREAFGFNLPSLPNLGLLSDEEAAEPLVFAVRDVEKVGRSYYIYLENGQVWKDLSGEITRVPRGDLEAIIKPASLNSYKMTLRSERESIRAIRVRRVE